MRRGGLVLLGLACWACAPVRSLPGRAAPRENPWGHAVRTVLVPQCGSCHQPGLESSVAGALAVFDLTADDWYGRMSTSQLESLGVRVRGGSSFVDSERAVVGRFLDCALAEACDP